MHQQVHPPIARLCAPIEGTDAAQLAVCLGLNPRRYGTLNTCNPDEADQGFDGNLINKNKFEGAEKLSLVCHKCRSNTEFGGFFEKHGSLIENGYRCNKCSTMLELETIEKALRRKILQFIRRYGQFWLICDDSMCLRRTRAQSVLGSACLNPGCSGTMNYEVRRI